ncbi:hypothetical protein QQ045_010285 [Rhodiola kirilowii]
MTSSTDDLSLSRLKPIRIMSQKKGAASDFASSVRPRRRTPYDSPEPVPTAASSPSDWLSTAGRVLVTGAVKLISSIMDSDTSSYCDSGAYSDEVDIQDGQLETESQQVIFSGESKQKIKELIMQETFSREESDILIQMIRSRELCENEEELLGSTELKPVKVEMKLDAEIPVPEETTDLPDSEVQQFQGMSIRRLRKMLKEYSQKPCHLSVGKEHKAS